MDIALRGQKIGIYNKMREHHQFTKVFGDVKKAQGILDAGASAIAGKDPMTEDLILDMQKICRICTRNDDIVFDDWEYTEFAFLFMAIHAEIVAGYFMQNPTNPGPEAKPATGAKKKKTGLGAGLNTLLPRD